MIMKRIYWNIVVAIITLHALLLTSCSDDTASGGSPVAKPEVTTINVDVVLPASVQEEWKQTINMAQSNIAQAQTKQRKQVK